MCKCETQESQIKDLIRMIDLAQQSERYDLDYVKTDGHKNWILGFLDATDMVLDELKEMLGDE